MKNSKILIVVGDGMADRPVKEFGGKTPLEEANTENMDELARSGICGLLDPIKPGIVPGSAPAHLAILGYNPYETYTGRGPFEAAGIGIAQKDTDIAFRCNFATVNEDLVVVDRRAGRNEYGLDELTKAINEQIKLSSGVKFKYVRSVSHRAVLILSGEDLSADISDVDPEEPGKSLGRAKPLVDTREAKLTADVVNEFVEKVHELLKNHEINKERAKRGIAPANIVLPRGPGKPPRMKTLKELYGFEHSACIAEVALVRGVAYFAGMALLNVSGATGGLDTDTRAIADATVKAIEENDVVLVNVKGPDVAGHDGKFEDKVRIIEKIDDMIGRVLDNVGLDNLHVAVLADHTTPVEVQEHTGDPVPLAIAGFSVRTDKVKEYNERSVSDGGLCRIRGVDLMPILVNYSNRAKKYGA